MAVVPIRAYAVGRNSVCVEYDLGTNTYEFMIEDNDRGNLTLRMEQIPTPIHPGDACGGVPLGGNVINDLENRIARYIQRDGDSFRGAINLYDFLQHLAERREIHRNARYEHVSDNKYKSEDPALGAIRGFNEGIAISSLASAGLAFLLSYLSKQPIGVDATVASTIGLLTYIVGTLAKKEKYESNIHKVDINNLRFYVNRLPNSFEVGNNYTEIRW